MDGPRIPRGNHRDDAGIPQLLEVQFIGRMGGVTDRLVRRAVDAGGLKRQVHGGEVEHLLEIEQELQ
jgi:hypothetical protein